MFKLHLKHLKHYKNVTVIRKKVKIYALFYKDLTLKIL